MNLQGLLQRKLYFRIELCAVLSVLFCGFSIVRLHMVVKVRKTFIWFLYWYEYVVCFVFSMQEERKKVFCRGIVMSKKCSKMRVCFVFSMQEERKKVFCRGIVMSKKCSKMRAARAARSLSAFHQILERFSNDCGKTKTKAITPTNHDRSRQRDEPITIASNYL